MESSWKCCAKCMSDWKCIQTQVSFIIIWCAIMLGLSGWTMQSQGGDFSQLHAFNSTSQPYLNWQQSVCESSPYMYLKPFSFTYSINGKSSSVPSYCGYQSSSSSLRLVITVFACVTAGILLMESPLSFFARPIFVTYGFLFFAAMVLDSNATAIGIYSCTLNFDNTDLQNFIASNNIVLNCQSPNYAGVAVVDVILSIQFFFIASSWILCKNRYSTKTIEEDRDAKTMRDMETL